MTATARSAGKTAEEITEIYEILSRTQPTYAESGDPWMTNGLSSTPFKALVSGALSTMTVTSRVIAAAVPLFERAHSFADISAMPDDELREIIRSVAHYNRKTVLLKRMSQQIIERHDGQVPDTREELMALAGIGRKVTDLTLTYTHGQATVAVDTHVQRLVHRLGIVTTTDAERTAEVLTELTPLTYRAHAHEWLIAHGAKVCRARAPRCTECPLAHLCDDFATRTTDTPTGSEP